MKEERFWRMVGMGSVAGGVIILVAAYLLRNRFAWETALAVGLAGSFITLAGGAGVVASHVMEGIATGQASCQGLMRGIAWPLIVLGIAVVAWAGIHAWGVVPTMKQIAEGAAGSFLLMFGILHLLGERTLRMIGGKAGAAGA